MSDSRELDARFGSDIAGGVPQRAGQATQVEQARAIAEVRAAVMIAMDRPRDRVAAIAEMRDVCCIQSLAERAFFRVQRGREKDANGAWKDAFVNGETIHLARELARCWGNIDYGVKELARDDIRGQSELLAFAWDLQTNARSEITFIVPHMRGSGEKRKRLTGTQEVYENNASFAGRRLREAIFSVLPVWFKAEAAEICHETLKTGGGKPLVQRIADLRTAFEALGVAPAQLERKRGRKIDDFLPEDVAALRVVYLSLKREEVTIAEEFPPPDGDRPTAAATGDKLAALEQVTTTTAASETDEAARDRDPFDLPPLQTEQASSESGPGGVAAAQSALSIDRVRQSPGEDVQRRDPDWWSRPALTIDWRDQRAGEFEMNRRLKEARTEIEVQALRDDNGEMIDALPKATRQDVLAALMDREKALSQAAA